ncbi:MAG: hypothetical protein ACXVF0_04610 [Blastococcus sp.]
MTPDRLTRTAMALALLLTPLLGLVAAVTLPASSSGPAGEIAAIAAQPGRFYVYAITILASSCLTVPAFFGVMTLLRERAPMWRAVGGGLAQIGAVIAVGDAATELLYWQMGAPQADQAQMAALADRYENAPGASVVYAIGGLAALVGVLLMSVALWRVRVAPRYAAAGLLLGTVANVVGLSMASRPIVVAGYVVLLAAFTPIGLVLLGRAAAAPVATTGADTVGASVG